MGILRLCTSGLLPTTLIFIFWVLFCFLRFIFIYMKGRVRDPPSAGSLSPNAHKRWCWSRPQPVSRIRSGAVHIKDAGITGGNFTCYATVSVSLPLPCLNSNLGIIKHTHQSYLCPYLGSQILPSKGRNWESKTTSLKHHCPKYLNTEEEIDILHLGICSLFIEGIGVSWLSSGSVAHRSRTPLRSVCPQQWKLLVWHDSDLALPWILLGL